MKSLTSATAPRLALLPLLAALIVGLAWPLGGAAQDKAPDPGTHKHADKDLAAQIAELRATVTKLEAALAKGQQGKSPGMSGMGGTGMMDMGMMMGGMGGQKKGMGGMSGMGGMMDMDMMKGGGMGMMEDDMDMMGMMGKGSMGGMGAKGMKMKMASALPGFPGASHIYHIGATDFFLDHPEHITLTTEQQTKLNKAKQKALTAKASTQRKIDEAEQQLWELTAADEPDAAQIQAKVQEIEKLRGEQRLAFIRAVGEAAKTLTDQQRQALLGNAKPQTHQHAAPPSK